MRCPFGDRALKKNKRAVTKPVSYGGKQKKVLIKKLMGIIHRNLLFQN